MADKTVSDSVTAPSGTSSGVEDAAAYLLLLGEKCAAEVIKHLSPSEIRTISHRVEILKFNPKSDINGLLERFNHELASLGPLSGNFQSQMRETLQKALGKQQARCLLTPLFQEQDRLMGLQLMKSDQLTAMIREEPLQFQAAILACLPPEQVHEVLHLLPKQHTHTLLERIALLNKLPKSSLQTIAELLEQYLEELSIEEYLPIAGERQVADILNLMDNDQSQEFLSVLKKKNTAIAKNIEEQMLVFEHILRLSEKDLRKLLATIEQSVLATALKGCSEQIREKVFNAMNKRAAEYLHEEMEVIGALPLEKVNNKRRVIVKKMEAMIEQKEIELPKVGETLVE